MHETRRVARGRSCGVGTRARFGRRCIQRSRSGSLVVSRDMSRAADEVGPRCQRSSSPRSAVQQRASPGGVHRRKHAFFPPEKEDPLKPNTLDQTLRELSCLAAAMAPDRDWRWVRMLPGRPTARAIRASKKPKRVFDVTKLCCDALDLMDRIEAGISVYETSILFRNSLIVARQCVFALRRRSLFDMRLGRNGI